MLLELLLITGAQGNRQIRYPVDSVECLKKQLATANISVTALQHIQKIFPGEKTRNRSTLSFAKDILAIEPSEGFNDDLKFLGLLTGGMDVSGQIGKMLEGLSQMTDAQRKELEAIQHASFERTAEFFSQVLGIELMSDDSVDFFDAPPVSSMSSAENMEPLWQVISGIGEKTAARLSDHDVNNLIDLAHLSDEQVEEINHALKTIGPNNASKWREQAITELAGS